MLYYYSLYYTRMHKIILHDILLIQLSNIFICKYFYFLYILEKYTSKNTIITKFEVLDLLIFIHLLNHLHLPSLLRCYS